MDHPALGRAYERRGETRAPGDIATDNAGSEQAPVASVIASAELEQVPTAAPAADPLTSSQTKVVAVLFFSWYVLNAIYNITSKTALIAIDLPWSICAAHLIVGSLLVLPLWVLRLRNVPRPTMTGVKGISLIAVCHMLSLVWALIGIGVWPAGAVPLVHMVKATEPLFTALFSAIFLKQNFSPLVYLTLVPVIVGVGMISLGSLSFNWHAFVGAVGSNVAASTRTVFSKRLMGTDMGKNMSPANLCAVVSIMASVMFVPLWIVMEASRVEDVWEAVVDSPDEGEDIIFYIVVSSVFFYLFNEVAFRCLGRVHPVTHAVGNTFKRVFLLAASFIVFKSTLDPRTAVGSSIAIVGVLMYRLAGK